MYIVQYINYDIRVEQNSYHLFMYIIYIHYLCITAFLSIHFDKTDEFPYKSLRKFSHSLVFRGISLVSNLKTYNKKRKKPPAKGGGG